MSNFENPTWRTAAILNIISAANHPNCTKFSTQTQNLPQVMASSKKFTNSKMADGL